MKKLLKTIILVLFTIVFLNNNNQAVADTSREPTRCKISNIVFSPTENITKDSEIELIITPGHEDCYKERIEFNFSIIEVNGGLGNFDKTVYQESANFHSNGDPFKLKFKPGDEYCEGEKCQYYIEATTKNKDGFNPLSTYNNGIIRASNTWHSSEYGNLKGLFNVSSINIVKGGQLQFNEGGGKTKFQAISKTEDEVIEPTPGSQCRIAENGIIFTPHGAQNDTPSEPFINKDSQKELKLTVKTIDCKDIKLEISIWDINKSIWNVNEEVEDAAVSGYPKENGEMNIVYIPGDDDCDGKKNGDGYCNYTLRVKAGNKVLHKLKFEEIKNQKDRIGYYCGINGCDKNPWEIKIQDTGTRSGTDQGAQGIQTQQPTYDTNSPCYDKTSQKYKENCYETLAAVPGIGTEQVVNGKKTGRWYIENTRDYQLGDYIQQMFNLALAVLMVLSVIMIVIAGVEYMTVESIYGKSDAKKRITSAVLGLILGLGIFTILNTINPELLEINFGKGIDVASIKIEETGEDGGISTIVNYSKKYSNDNACDETKNNPTCVNIPPGITIKTGAGNKVEKEFSGRLESFKNELSRNSVVNNWQVTEAFKRTRVHKSKCHYIGTCIDMNFTGSMKNNPSSVNIKDVINAADKSGLCAIYEIGTTNTTKNQMEPKRQKLIQDGIPANKVKNYAGWISAPHFSIYNGSC